MTEILSKFNVGERVEGITNLGFTLAQRPLHESHATAAEVDSQRAEYKWKLRSRESGRFGVYY